MNDIEFFNAIVMPTVDEFTQNPGDIRRGVLACLVLQSMNEHDYEHHKSVPGDVLFCKNAEFVADEWKTKLGI